MTICKFNQLRVTAMVVSVILSSIITDYNVRINGMYRNWILKDPLEFQSFILWNSLIIFNWPNEVGIFELRRRRGNSIFKKKIKGETSNVKGLMRWWKLTKVTRGGPQPCTYSIIPLQFSKFRKRELWCLFSLFHHLFQIRFQKRPLEFFKRLRRRKNIESYNFRYIYETGFWI